MRFEMMDMEFNELSSDRKIVDQIPSKTRVKTSNRMNYEAQVDVIRKQIGDLESIRGKLNLSQRKMAQLLLVDPSAWSRWTAQGESAPPHIYRALQWYMTLQEQVPGLNAAYFLQKDTHSIKAELSQLTQDKLQNFELEMKSSTKAYIEELQAYVKDLKARTDDIVHQSSKDILKLEDEVISLKSDIAKAEKNASKNLKQAQSEKRKFYFLIMINLVSVLGTLFLYILLK